MIPYESAILLSVASPGKYNDEALDGLLGQMRSRSGAKLKYVTNDIEKFGEDSPSYGGYAEGGLIYEKLLDPSVTDFREATKRLIKRMVSRKSTPGRKNVFNLVYAGHGQALDGAFELIDGIISGQELHELLVLNYGDNQNKLHVNLIVDSCYSGRFLIDFMVSCQNHKTVYAFDCNVSSLPDERSFEMDFLEHGAFSFTLSHQGNSYVDASELARAVDDQDLGTIVKSLQSVTVPNPVAFLTRGRQHSMELVSGHHLSVTGAGSIELSDHFGSLTHAGLADAVARAKTDYGGDTEYNS